MKDLLQLAGSGLRKRITIISSGLVIENVETMEVSGESDLWKTLSKSLSATVEGKHDLTNEWVLAEFGMWDKDTIGENPTDDLLTWHRFGRFLVLKDGFTYDDDKNQTTINSDACFDLMVLTQKEWKIEDLGLTFPTTVYQVVNAICTLTGITLETQSWKRSDHVIEEDKWSSNLMTYRNALDDIATFCNATISIENDEMVIKSISRDVIGTIDTGMLSFKKEAYFGDVNIVNFTREPQHDNYSYPTNWSSIPLDERVELAITNNQILDKRREELAPLLFADLEGFGYTPFEYTGFGYLTMKFGDYVKIIDKEEGTHYSYITKFKWTVKTGFTEMLGSGLTSNAVSEYVVFGDQRRNGMRVYLQVDQQNGKILGLINDVEDNRERTSQLEIDVESIRLEVSQLGGYNIISNILGKYGYLDWTFNAEPFLFKQSEPFALMGDNIQPIFFMDNEMRIAYPVETDTQSTFGWRYWHTGLQLSKIAPAQNGTEYSLHMRTKGTGTLTFKLREYSSVLEDNKSNYIKETILGTTVATNNWSTFERTLTLDDSTNAICLVIQSNVNVYSQQYAIHSNGSFNVGQPKPYGESLTDVNNRVDHLTARVELSEDKVDVFTQKVTNIDGVVTNQQALLQVHSSEIALTVRKNNVRSAINQSAESIKIQANALELSGYATFSALSTSGQTTIHGGNIVSNTITASKLNVDQLSSLSSNLGAITGGSLNIGSGRFVVSSAGNLTANNVNLTGTINATSGTFRGTIDTTQDVVVGTRIRTPIIKPTTTTEMATAMGGERGGIMWGMEINSSGATTKVPDAYMVAMDVASLLGVSKAVRLTTGVRNPNSGATMGMSESSMQLNYYSGNIQSMLQLTDGFGAVARVILSDSGTNKTQYYEFGIGSYYPMFSVASLGTTSYRWGQLFTTTSPNVSSTRTIKHEIEPIKKNYILDLQAVQYLRSDSDDGLLHYGFIAEDVYDLTKGKDFFSQEKSIVYEELIGQLVDLAQKQDKRIQALESR